MAEKEQRVTRSSSGQKEKASESERTDKPLAVSEFEKLDQSTNRSSVRKHKKESAVNLDVESSLEVPQSTSTSAKCTRRQNSDKPSKKVSTRKKRPSSENETEKENLNLSDECKGEKSTAVTDKLKTKSIQSEERYYCDQPTCALKKKKVAAACECDKTSSRSKKESEPESDKTSEATLVAKPLPPTNFQNSIQSSLEKSQISSAQLAAVVPLKTKNICQQYFDSAVGKSLFPNTQAVSSRIASNLANFEVVDNDHPFQCRITAIEWHPRKANFLGVGSKHGDKVFYKIKKEDYSRLEVVQKFNGIGPGGNISSMKFHPTKDNMVYTSSLCGKVVLNDIEGRLNQVLLDTMSWDFWYSALDVHPTDCVALAGRNKGQVVLLDKEGKLVWEKRLHAQKISHLEFSPENANIFCTASMDHTVRIWDLRNIQEKNPLEVLFHNHGLNSASFSLTGGSRLVTTDQKDELRVYISPMWHVEKVITHPHRFFQHITPIKAYWHPHKDIVLCGRYPDTPHLPQFDNLRSIDMFDVSSGKLIGELKDTLYDGIISLTKMNASGTKLVCSMGYNINLWNHEATFSQEDLSKSQMDAFRKSRDTLAKNTKRRGRDGSWNREKKDDKKGKDKHNGRGISALEEVEERMARTRPIRQYHLEVPEVRQPARVESRETPHAQETDSSPEEEEIRRRRGTTWLSRLFNYNKMRKPQ